MKMKNKEKFAKEIVELACNGEGIAVNKHSGMVFPCNNIPCSNCLFDNDYYCEEERKKMGRVRVHRKVSDSDKQEGQIVFGVSWRRIQIHRKI